MSATRPPGDDKPRGRKRRPAAPPGSARRGAGSPAEPAGTPAPAGATARRSAGRPAPPRPLWPAPDAFPSSVGPIDLHLLGEGRHLRLHEVLGGHPRSVDGVAGATFAVWAPGARRVWVTGDMNAWERDSLPLRLLGPSGVHERFVPRARAGQAYKFVLEGQDGQVRLKTDPFARLMEQPPGNAAVLAAPPAHAWGDGEWLARRAAADHARAPISMYEVHLGSWVRSPEGPLGYRQAIDVLVPHVAELGFTHVELLPVMEHPFGGSWGYQVTGYFAPTSRWGSPDELRALIDAFHRRGIGVILDWVPAHFPRDEHALYRYDGTALFEHLDPRKGHHPDWHTAIFNYGRNEVANFLLASALHWLRDYHADGIRVDAVASMLYLDYSRKEGEWERNVEGGSSNLEAMAFIQRLTSTLRAEVPGCLLVAEESTTWPGVTAPVERGGLGFHLKWNMGWMHDTLQYFGTDPLFRGGAHDRLTFGLVYEPSERFLCPLSHDEVVHGKGSLLARMPGDEDQRLANLRALLVWQFTRPGKKLLFMGTELASLSEWNHDGSLDWQLSQEPRRVGLRRFLTALGALYRERPCLWRGDPEPASFTWLVVDDRARSVFAYLRRWDEDCLVVVLNLTPVLRRGYVLHLPVPGPWVVLLDSSGAEHGGTGAARSRRLRTRGPAAAGPPHPLTLDLAPLSAVVLAPRTGAGGNPPR